MSKHSSCQVIKSITKATSLNWKYFQWKQNLRKCTVQKLNKGKKITRRMGTQRLKAILFLACFYIFTFSRILHRFYNLKSFFLWVYMCATQLHPTLCDPMDCSSPGSSVHRISQARILEWVAISYSRGSSQLRDWTRFSALAGRFFTTAPPRKSPFCLCSSLKHEVLLKSCFCLIYSQAPLK